MSILEKHRINRLHITALFAGPLVVFISALLHRTIKSHLELLSSEAHQLHPLLPLTILIVGVLLGVFVSASLWLAGNLYAYTAYMQAKTKELKTLAHSDYLTGLYNRAHFDSSLKKAVSRCRRKKLRFALLYLDLDGFKAFNDKHGHKIGDLVLIRLTKHLKTLLREYDTLARIGGDEFALILYDTTEPQEATTIAKRVIESVKANHFSNDTSIQLGISVGIAHFPESGLTAETLMEHADKALYKAKSRGKNQFQLWDSRPEIPGS